MPNDTDSLPAPTEESKQEFPSLREGASQPEQSATVPPSWDDVKANPKFETASPEEKLITFSRWHDDAYNHATQQPFWQDKTQQDTFNNKAAQIQTELSQAAGGLSPDQARVKVARDAVNTAHGDAVVAESERPGHEIERDAISTLNPDIRRAYYADKAKPPTGAPVTPELYKTPTMTGEFEAGHYTKAAQLLMNKIGIPTSLDDVTSDPGVQAMLKSPDLDRSMPDPNDPGWIKALKGVSNQAIDLANTMSPAMVATLAAGSIPMFHRLAASAWGAYMGATFPQSWQNMQDAVANTAVGSQERLEATIGMLTHLGMFSGIAGGVHPAIETPKDITQAAKEAQAPKTAAEVSPLTKEVNDMLAKTTAQVEQTPDIHVKQGKVIAPEGTTVEHLRDFYRTLPAALRTPNIITAFKNAAADLAKKAPETVLGPSLAGEVGKAGETHADLLTRASGGPYAGVALERFGQDEGHTFRTSKGRDVSRAEAFSLARAEQEKTGKQILKPGIIEAVDSGTKSAELQSGDLQPRPEAKAEEPAILSKWWETFKPEPKAVEPKSAAEPKPFDGTVEEAAHQAPENLQIPKGATRVRATDTAGKTSVIGAKDLDTLKEAGPFSKIEAGTMSKGKFLPMKEEVTLRPQPKAELAKPRPIPAWMLKDEEESKLGKGDFAKEMKGRGPTPEQKELQIKIGSEFAHKRAINEGFSPTYNDLHKFTGDSTTASALKEEIEEKLAKKYPPQKIPTDAKQIMVKHKETGIKYPTAELPTGEIDAKGKPITKMGTPFTNDALKVAAAFDEGKPQVVPQSLLLTDKVNPAISYDEATGKVTGVQTKYGFVEKPGDLTRLYNDYTKIAHPQKAPDLVHGEKALAAAENQGRETGAEDIHEPEQLGSAVGAGDEIPQGRTSTPDEVIAADESARFDRIMEEADKLGIDPSTIQTSDDARDPDELGAKGVKTSFVVNTPEESTKILQTLHEAGIWRADGKLAPNPLGAYLRWMAAQGKDFPNLIAKEILENSALQTGDLLFEVVNNPKARWAGLYTPKESVEAQRLGLKQDRIQVNIALSQGIHETMLHELVHGVFEPVLYDPARQTPRITELWHNIQTLGETARKYAFQKLYGHEPSNQELIDFKEAYRTGKQVGKFQKNNHSALTFIGDNGEIPTRVLTDKDVQEIFASIDADPKVPAPKPGGKFSNLLDQAIAYVKLLWPGKNVTPGTLLDQAIDQVVDFIRETGKGPETTLPRAGPEMAESAKGKAKKIAGFDWDALANLISGPEKSGAETEPMSSGWLSPSGEHIQAAGEQEHAETAMAWIDKNDPKASEKLDLGSSHSEIYDHMFKKGFVRVAGGAGFDIYIEGKPTAAQLRVLKDEAISQHVSLIQDLISSTTSKPLGLTKVLYSPSEKMEAGKLAAKPGGEIVETMRRGGVVSHELEIDPKATADQLLALDKQVDSSSSNLNDKTAMKAQIQKTLERVQPFVPQVAVPQAQAEHTAPTGIIGSLRDEALGGWWNRVKTTVQAAANKTFPRTTLVDRTSGELMARWVASRTAAPYKSNRFIAHVLEGTDLDSAKFGAALTEDNLRSIEKTFRDKGDTEKADRVGSIVGQKGSPFQTEKEYQEFLNDNAVKQAIARHIMMWNEVVDPMYKQAMLIDPDVELASRGLQTGARINLFAVKEGETGGIVSGFAPGNLRATLQRKSPFGRQAKGTGTYNADYADMMANTFGQQSEIANKNAFEKQLVASGNAIIGKPGERPVLADGEDTHGVPMRTLTVQTKEGATIPLNRNLYIRKSLVQEYLRAADTEGKGYGEIVTATTSALNKAALAGFTDFTVHGSNLFTALTTRPSISGALILDTALSTAGRSDVLVTTGKLILKSMKDNEQQLGELAEIGALRDYGTIGKSKYNPLTWSGKTLNWMDKTTRLMLDDAYQSLVKGGWAEDTETARREFINQVGQYNRRAQNRVLRLARDTGIGPFATAGTTFNALGFRVATLNPGIKASTAMAATALRVNQLSKIAGGVVLVGALNYVIVGKMLGRPGVPIGNVDTGRTDANGRPLSVPVFKLLGIERGMRITGIKGALESYRKGLTPADMENAAIRDIINAQISPFAGPIVHFASAVTGIPTMIGAPPPSPMVAPGENQFKSNVINAIVQSNPVSGSIRELRRGAGLTSALEKQFPRFVPQPTQPLEMMAKYPEIVRKAQSSTFINDVIRQARYMEPNERSMFVRDALDRLSTVEDREHAKKTLRYRRIKY